MEQQSYQFSQQRTDYYFGAPLEYLAELVNPQQALILADRRVAELYESRLKAWRVLRVPSGEGSKEWPVCEDLIRELIFREADRKTMLVGLGGGVITDLTGFLATIYMRGLPLGLVPTTLLGQVDAGLGGKNGINFGRYKNLLGTIRQPEFILLDPGFFHTLPQKEWTSGLAEVIKYACILDEPLFDLLEKERTAIQDKDPVLAGLLVRRCAHLKSLIVQQDEKENHQRRWLNFGHTLGHPVEKIEQIPHGMAISIGMVAAARLSETITGLDSSVTSRLRALLSSYGLPVDLKADRGQIVDLFKLDKKRERESLHFVLLEGLGKAVTRTLPLRTLEEFLYSL